MSFNIKKEHKTSSNQLNKKHKFRIEFNFNFKTFVYIFKMNVLQLK
jgi:hypothetical protein